jgi:hypothetical protein
LITAVTDLAINAPTSTTTTTSKSNGFLGIGGGSSSSTVTQPVNESDAFAALTQIAGIFNPAGTNTPASANSGSVLTGTSGSALTSAVSNTAKLSGQNIVLA